MSDEAAVDRTGISAASHYTEHDRTDRRRTLRLDGHPIHDDKHFSTLTATGVVQSSSNVGTTKTALLLSVHDTYANFQALGLGRRPRAGLPRAAAGQGRPYKRWRRIE
ncbi:penicillin-binding transpeptidase domain-containing protein [Caballeronia arvi]|uniref:penicillin-binding transpeptidase domain-containing protein n=1 Tax=Caballeronia arvi TaxID=1777135 RepID=UPI000AC58ADD